MSRMRNIKGAKATISHFIYRRKREMAGTAMHLAIADRVAVLFGKENIKNLPYFFSGSIAPDAIHARANYERSMKKHTHLTEGISNSDFIYPDKLAIFRERLDRYIKTYYHREDDDAELYLGWIVHLITDELFNIHIYSDGGFASRLKQDGVNPNEMEFFHRFMYDMNLMDELVMKNYAFVHDVERELSAAWGLGVKDMILPEESDASKNWVISKLFHSNFSDLAPVYYSKEEAYDFILKSSDEIVNRIMCLLK